MGASQLNSCVAHLLILHAVRNSENLPGRQPWRRLLDRFCRDVIHLKGPIRNQGPQGPSSTTCPGLPNCDRVSCCLCGDKNGHLVFEYILLEAPLRPLLKMREAHRQIQQDPSTEHVLNEEIRCSGSTNPRPHFSSTPSPWHGLLCIVS